MPWKLIIPEFTDFFGQPAGLLIDLIDSKTFLKYDETERTIQINGDSEILENYQGSYTVEYTLSDSLD